MTSSALLAELDPLKGRQLIECIDEIKSIAGGHRFSVNVRDPEFNVVSIDRDYRRLNVLTDANSVITSFTIG